MPSYNKVIIAGNITRAPELKSTRKGTSVVNFGVAVNRELKNEAGQQVEDVDFFDVTAWGRTGEVIQEHLHKGDPILLDGRLSQEQWEDKQTKEKRSKVVIILETFTFIGKKAAAACMAAGLALLLTGCGHGGGHFGGFHFFHWH